MLTFYIGAILHSFKTEYYPVVEIQTNEKLDFYPDNEVEIARINITKDGYPYLTKSENINAILKDDLGENVDLNENVNPSGGPDPGTSFKFNLKISSKTIFVFKL